MGTSRKQRPKTKRGWLLEAGSGTHNEFRLAARPLSGDQGVSAPLLINTRGGSELQSVGRPTEHGCVVLPTDGSIWHQLRRSVRYSTKMMFAICISGIRVARDLAL